MRCQMCPLHSCLQFVVSSNLPHSSYMTALQQVVAAGYVTLTCIGLEAVVIWRLTTYHSHGKRCVMTPGNCKHKPYEGVNDYASQCAADEVSLPLYAVACAPIPIPLFFQAYTIEYG